MLCQLALIYKYSSTKEVFVPVLLLIGYLTLEVLGCGFCPLARARLAVFHCFLYFAKLSYPAANRQT